MLTTGISSLAIPRVGVSAPLESGMGVGSSSTGQWGLVWNGVWTITLRCQLELLWVVASLEQREKFQEKNHFFFLFKS